MLAQNRHQKQLTKGKVHGPLISPVDARHGCMRGSCYGVTIGCAHREAVGRRRGSEARKGIVNSPRYHTMDSKSGTPVALSAFLLVVQYTKQTTHDQDEHRSVRGEVVPRGRPLKLHRRGCDEGAQK